MDYKIPKLLKRAENDLDEILTRKAELYAGTADRFIIELEKRLDNIAANPYMYQSYINNHRYRRAVLDEYLLFYRIIEETQEIKIYRVLHSKKDLRKYFKL
jgi:plasmid stabilization system protein ParE